jgi:hypothetical protein
VNRLAAGIRESLAARRVARRAASVRRVVHPDPLVRKLNLCDRTAVLLVDAPPESAPLAAALEGQLTLAGPADAALLWATRRDRVQEVLPQLTTALTGDAVLWICYPKGRSKKYSADFNRDTIAEVPGAFGFEPVRQVALDADWSALRFRRAEFVRTMTRTRAVTEAGRARLRAAPLGGLGPAAPA